MKNIGEIVREHRNVKNWGMQQLADRVNVSSAYISNIENEKLKTPPSKELLQKMAVVLEMSKEEENELLYIAEYNRTPELIKQNLEKTKQELIKLQQIIREAKLTQNTEDLSVRFIENEEDAKFAREFAEKMKHMSKEDIASLMQIADSLSSKPKVVQNKEEIILKNVSSR